MTITRGSGGIAPSNSTSSSGGGISQWDPVLDPNKIKPGIYRAPGIFVLNNDFNGIIDDISSSKKGTIIYFFKNTQRWAIISGEDKNKGVYSTYSALLVAYPSSTDGDYALITSTNSFFAYYNNIWNDTGTSVAPDALRSTNNLSDLTDKVASRINLGVDSTVQSDAKLLGKKNKITPITATTKGTASKTVTVQVNDQGDTLLLTEQDIAIASTQVTDFIEASQDAIGGALLDTPTIDLTYNDATNKISADVKALSLDNSHISATADIATSKTKQATITPIDAIFANGDKQDVINNKAQGQHNANKTLATHVNRSILDGIEESFTTAKQAKYEGAYTHSIATGNPHGTTISDITGLEIALGAKEVTANKGQINGYAGLDSTGKVPSAQLPAFVDDVLEFANLASLPAIGETGKIYITIDTNLEYRWSGTQYINIAKGDVQSVNTKTGAVVLNQDEILDGAIYKQYSLTEKTKLAGIQEGAEVNVQADYAQTDNTQDNFIKNKPTLRTASSKDVGTAVDNILINGSILQPLQILETDANGKAKTSAKNSAYNLNFGNTAGTVVEGGTVYTKADVETFITGAKNRQNHTGEQAISTITNLATILAEKANTVDLIDSNGFIKSTLLDPLNAKFVTANEKTNLETITRSSANGFVKISNGVASLQTLIQNSELATGINVNKLANGTVANEEFQTLDGIDITKTIQAQINELKAKAIQKRYVSPGTQGYGSDSYDGKSEATPFATLAKLNSPLASGGIDGSGFLVIHLPSQGTESVTFTQANIAIVGEAKRDFCGTTGTITANPASSSQVYQTFSIGTFVKSGAFYVILDGVAVKTALSHTGTGSLDMIDCDFATTPLSLTAAGTTRLYNCRGGVPTLNNASGFLFVGGNESISAPTITAGFMFLKNCIISGTITLNGGTLKMQRCTVVVAQGTTLTLGVSGATLILDNIEFTYPDGTPAKIDVPSGVFFSFSGINIYKDTSTLNGTDLSSANSNYLRYAKINTANFPSLTASTIASFDANKNLASLPLAQYPSLAELSYVKGGTSSFQTQLDAKAVDSTVAHLAGAETFTNIKTFASAPIFSSLIASQRLELDANKNLISVAKGSADNQDYSTIVGDLKANGTASLGPKTQIPRIDHIHPTDTSRAPIDSPSFTGIPLVPTAPAGTNNNQSASTAFVATLINALKGSPTAAGDTLKELEDRIIAVEALLSTATDGDTIVNTYYELLQAAQNFPEGSTFLGELNKRVSFGTIANRPTAVAGNNGYVYITIDGVSTTGSIYISNGTSWVQVGYSKTEIDSSLAIKQPLNSKLTALGALNTARGILVQNGIDTGSETFVKRQITGGTGIGVNNGDGVLGNPTISIQTGNTADKACAGNDARLGTKDIDETNQANNRILSYNSSLDKIVYVDKASGIYTVNSTAEMVLLTNASLNELAIVRNAEPYTLYQLTMLPATVLSNWKIVGGGSGGSGGFPVVNDYSETVSLNNQVSTGTTHYIGQFVEFVGRPTAVPITTTEKPTLIVYGTLAKVVQIFIHSGITYTRERINDLWGDWKTPASSSGGGLDYIQGFYDASSNVYPTSANTLLGDTVQKGYKWIVSVQGILGTKIVFPDCIIEARENNPEQTSTKWQTYQNTLGYIPENIAFKNQANGYLGTDSSNQFSPSFVKQNANNRFTSDTEKATWNAKQNALPTGLASQYLNGIGSLAQVDHADLSNKGTNTHAQIDTALSRLQNTSGTNTGDETTTTIKTKLGASSSSSDGYLATADFSDFASRVTQTQLSNGLDTKQASSTTLTTLATSTNPQTLVKIALTNPTSSDSGKNFQVNSNGDVVLVTSGTGNVICNDTTANGDFVMFSADKTVTKKNATEIKTALGLTLTDVSNTAVTLTPAQKRITAKNLGGYPSLTTTERDTITDWAVNEQLYNTTLGRLEKWNGTIFVSALNNIGSFIYSYSSTPPLNSIRCDGTAISRTNYYELFSLLNPNIATSITASISIASPCVVGKTSHGLAAGGMVKFTTTGTLPTGITAGTVYFVTPISTSQFYLSTSKNAFLEQVYVTTSGSQSGTHSYRYSLYGFGNDTTTFNVPDAQGLSLRTLDTTTNIDFSTPARVLGSMQTSGTAAPRNQTVKKITSTGGTTSTLDSATNPSYTGFVRVGKTGEGVTTTGSDSGGVNEMDIINAVTGDAETNVKNMALYLYIQVL